MKLHSNRKEKWRRLSFQNLTASGFSRVGKKTKVSQLLTAHEKNLLPVGNEKISSENAHSKTK
jgi:hypothetical protein